MKTSPIIDITPHEPSPAQVRAFTALMRGFAHSQQVAHPRSGGGTFHLTAFRTYLENQPARLRREAENLLPTTSTATLEILYRIPASEFLESRLATPKRRRRRR